MTPPPGLNRVKGTKFGRDVKFAESISKLKKKMPIEAFPI